MPIEVVPLIPAHLDTLLENAPPSLLASELKRAYFTPGSSACCLLSLGVPVFAGGIVNLQWNRGEAWIIPTPFFRSHIKTCYRAMRDHLPRMAQECGFVRVQATCIQGISASIFRHLGFRYEGTLERFGPFGQSCTLHSRIFEARS